MAKINLNAFRNIVTKELVIDTSDFGGGVFKYTVSDYHIRREADILKKIQTKQFEAMKKVGFSLNGKMSDPKVAQEAINKLAESVNLEEIMNTAYDIKVEFYKGFDGDLPSYGELSEMFRKNIPNMWETALDKFLEQIYNEFLEEKEKYSSFLDGTADPDEKK
ncbi:MAG: hypothetical protein EHM25_02775 [Nitrosopumilales archaeon]|nr:MAG: hypothetical protein EHM25_12595 [Nitrosopumilales archaeon]RPJ31578.1 MAG: hypothetical protein EHM25_02775 [Nitrosopumilales archaeon]